MQDVATTEAKKTKKARRSESFNGKPTEQPVASARKPLVRLREEQNGTKGKFYIKQFSAHTI